MLEISISAEKIGSLWGLPITNSLITTWFTMGILSVFTWMATRSVSLKPSSMQLVAEFIVGGLHTFFAQVTGKHINKFFPLVSSLFLFIITANWVGLLPGVGTIGLFHAVHEEVKFVPILRAATADLNTTIALALIAMVAVQYFGFSIAGPHYSSRFLNFKSPIMFFLGILELISDFSKIISFAFRLFGNIFAGEVLLAVLAFLIPFVVPLPFITMELFVGFIQALVFSMLTAVFLNVAVSHGEGHA